ncbi:hypothetical protein [Vibrio splendidus]|uniref:hypothetical protein n=1 Tax=Vibrio splendidus TaxID=29497 RepID=UPI000C81B8B4|nr:hypothetical protein [Vibrio splendidus]PMP37129.1 hypothetical protein BCS86_04360 [Vibrio splendidus]
MTNSELLEQALHSGAIIHQPHALKAFLSVNYLAERFGEEHKLLSHTSHMMVKDSVSVLPIYTESVQAPHLQDFRIHRMLDRGIYPAAYQATFQWYKNKGFKDIFSYYASKAASRNEYLSHNVTILLAMNKIYGRLSMEQVPPFLNRFTEFVTATFSNMGKEKYTVTKVSVADVLSSCIAQFGFFGHNLITLAWLLRCREQLSLSQYEAMLSNLYIQANSPLEDPEDNIDQSIWDKCEEKLGVESFDLQVKSLIFDYKSNLHQITFADALCVLQAEFPKYTAELNKIAQYQCFVLESESEKSA